VTAVKPIRCAIYTRKSTEEGLDQAFNSLDAQREACAAYIASQRHEGWVLSPELYDDGGFSGGNINRPGLVALMTEVKAGRIDVIIVYKVDRLTRSLADFAKIVEVLDAQGASFVSVTQSFNTTTSMGRLTLNVLLSFAQFEREVTGERIRDKVAASKKKGMWMGGPVPLGYDVLDRKLVVNVGEAATVLHIFETYRALGSVTMTVDALARQGVITKVSRTAAGGTRGGVPFSRGSLAHLLGNRVYRGEVRHRDAHYPGEHQAIIPAQLWDGVAAQLANRRLDRRSERNLRHGNVLGGLLYDGLGRPMRTCSASKGSRTYHYYASCADAGASGEKAPRRMPAHDLEKLVADGVKEWLADPMKVHNAVAELCLDQDALTKILTAAEALLANTDPWAWRDLIQRVEVNDDRVDIHLDIPRLNHSLETVALLAQAHTLSLAMVRVRRGKEVRLLIPGNDGGLQGSPDPALIKLLANAFAARDAVNAAANGQTLNDIANAQGYSLEYFSLLIRLSMLAPDIVEAIATGRQPSGLNRQRLARTTKLPIDWAGQRAALGFA
jgi:DNA invertase Pin-like site-specific DNA recombinase